MNPYDDAEQAAFLAAYVECALWADLSEAGPDGENLDSVPDVAELDADALRIMAEDCHVFCRLNAGALLDDRVTAEQAGHDFWLTRRGHGTGFWDRGNGELGDKLTAACEPWRDIVGGCYVYETAGVALIGLE